jgi:hypothetical protein
VKHVSGQMFGRFCMYLYMKAGPRPAKKVTKLLSGNHNRQSVCSAYVSVTVDDTSDEEENFGPR